MSVQSKILIADDDPDIRRVLRLLLEEQYSVLEAADGEEAVRLIRDNKDCDLVVLDVMMPRMDGYEACRSLREYSNAPVLFLTAKSAEPDKLNAYRSGGDDFLSKPFSGEELLAKVSSQLRRYKEYRGKPEAALAIENLEVDFSTRSVVSNGQSIPLTETGELMRFRLDGVERRGKDFLDYLDTAARRAYYLRSGSEERKLAMDLLWFLWAGRNSPIFGRDRMTTFERRLIADERAWAEPKNAYYSLYEDPAVCEMILREFGLEGPHCHIINGHVPVKARKGESPIKGGGKMIVIDGGFCKAYQPTSGIAGYTLIYNSHTLRIVAHQPFVGRERAIRENYDIASSTTIFERMEARQKIRETDIGREIQTRIDDLSLLLDAYRDGVIRENDRPAAVK